MTLDYKSLLLLIRKILGLEDEEDVHWEALGGQGFDVQGCVFCTAIRVSYKVMYKLRLTGNFLLGIIRYNGIQNFSHLSSKEHKGTLSDRCYKATQSHYCKDVMEIVLNTSPSHVHCLKK